MHRVETMIGWTRQAVGVDVLLATMLLTPACAVFYEPLPVAENVDLARYAGRWYEIARYPNRFQTGCTGVTADYELLRPPGRAAPT